MKKFKYIFLGSILSMAVNVSGQGYFQAGYGVALPFGNTKDFIPETSWRGFGLEAGAWLNDNISVGLSFSYNGFYEALDYDVYELEDITLWTKVWKYTNSYPVTGVVKYYLNTEAAFRPYMAAGIGTAIFKEETAFGMYYVDNKAWQFAVYPELGFVYWFSDETGLIFNSRFVSTTRSKDIKSQSYLGFNLGIIFYSF